MKIEGQHLFSAPPEFVWEAVTDPGVLAKVLPGCEDFHEIGENQFSGKLKIKVGPVQGDFQGNVQLSELNPPRSYRLQLKGKGAPGFVEGDGELQLSPQDNGGTLLQYSVDARIGGRIATVGQRLLDSSSKVITRQALEGLAQQVEARTLVAEADKAKALADAAQATALAAETREDALLANAEAAQATTEAAMAEAPDVADVPIQAPVATPTAAVDPATVRELAEQARLAAEAAAERAAAARAAAERTKTQSEFAADFAKGMANEMAPGLKKVAVVAVILAIAAVFLYFVL
jgi:carbon monoxide dehydrogenase subunit G